MKQVQNNTLNTNSNKYQPIERSLKSRMWLGRHDLVPALMPFPFTEPLVTRPLSLVFSIRQELAPHGSM